MRVGASVVAIAALHAAGFACQAAESYHVAGVVVNSESGSPMPGVHVMVLRAAAKVGDQITNSEGRFGFDLPQGTFHLQAGTRDRIQTYGLRTPQSRVGTSIITGPDQNTSNLRFVWFPTGTITGRITDEAGEPVESALVQLLSSTVFLGRRLVFTVTWARSDDRGEYRFGPLAAGSYFLAVTGAPWYSRRTITGRDSVRAEAYVPAYFPNASDVSQAAPLVVKPGQEARGDFSLSVTSGATVTVSHDAPPELKGSISLLTDSVAGQDGFQRTATFTGIRNDFTFTAVPPGRYLVRVTGSRGNTDFSGRKMVDVNGSDVSVNLEVRQAPAVSGTIQLKNPNAKLRGTVLAVLTREETGSSITTAVRPDGGFSFPSVAVAKWRPSIRGTAGYFVSETHVDGADFSGGVLNLIEGESATVRMLASDETGRLKGFVMRDDKPVESVMVVLAPAPDSPEGIRSRAFQTDSDGSFDLDNVPAGHYFLFAVDDVMIEYTNPAAVLPYRANAKPIVIEAHGTYSERIPVSEPPSHPDK